MVVYLHSRVTPLLRILLIGCPSPISCNQHTRYMCLNGLVLQSTGDAGTPDVTLKTGTPTHTLFNTPANLSLERILIQGITTSTSSHNLICNVWDIRSLIMSSLYDPSPVVYDQPLDYTRSIVLQVYVGVEET